MLLVLECCKNLFVMLQACKNGLVKHVEHLLYYGANADAENINGNTPLHVCSVNNRSLCHSNSFVNSFYGNYTLGLEGQFIETMKVQREI